MDLFDNSPDLETSLQPDVCEEDEIIEKLIKEDAKHSTDLTDVLMKNLFSTIKEGFYKNLNREEIDEIITSDRTLLETANSYCVKCGKCCLDICKSKIKLDDGKYHCMLHDNSNTPYPHSKKTFEFKRENLEKEWNPEEYAKPKGCYFLNPSYHLLGIIQFTREGNENKAAVQKGFCKGANDLFEKYKKFVDEIL